MSAPNGPTQVPSAWHARVIIEIEGAEREAILRGERAEQAAANKEATLGATKDGDGCCVVLEVFLDAGLAAVEGGDRAEMFDALPLDGTAGADLLDTIDKYARGESERLTSIDYPPDDYGE